jgi:hypothetical protein
MPAICSPVRVKLVFDKEVKHRTFPETVVRLMLGENLSRRARIWQQVGLIVMMVGLVIYFFVELIAVGYRH